MNEEGGDGEGTGSEVPSLRAYVSEEGGDGEGAGSEASSLLPYTPRYVRFAGNGRGWGHIKCTKVNRLCRIR